MQPRPPRIFTAGDILNGQVSLAGYPFRYIYVNTPGSSIFNGAARMREGTNSLADQLLSAVELLEAQGWQLVNIDISSYVACLRRIH